MIKKFFVVCLLVALVGCQTSIDGEQGKDDNVQQEQDELKDSNEEIIERKEITGQLTNSDLYNLNVYLSDLSSSGFKTYDKENLDHDQLLNLGFWLYVYEGMDKVDFEEVDGRYYDVFTYEEFNQKLNRYFECELDKKGNGEWLFQENKYYHPSLDMGYDLNKVTQVDRVFDNGNGSFLVEGSVYRFESSLEYNWYEQYLQPKSTWTASMDSELIGTVTTTIVYSEKLNHYILDDYQTNYFASNELVESELIDEDIEIFTPDKAVEYAESYYGIDEDTLYLADEIVQYDENGEMYYSIQLKSKSLAEAGGSGILFAIRVYEDGTIVE